MLKQNLKDQNVKPKNPQHHNTFNPTTKKCIKKDNCPAHARLKTKKHPTQTPDREKFFDLPKKNAPKPAAPRRNQPTGMFGCSMQDGYGLL
jgi:hypothetical protein